MQVRFRAWPLRGDHWLWLIILLALGLRTYHIAYPPWDYHNWRQTQTLMVARDFARNGFHLLHPQVQWVSNGGPAGPSYFSGEFSIESVLAALLYKLFGESDTLARTVVIAFSLVGIYFLYKLLNRFAGPIAARVGAFVYALLPYHLFFGRVFMPDVPALSLALGGLFFLSRWLDNRKLVTLVVAAILVALAILQKLTLIFVGLPALYFFWLAAGRRLFLRGELYLFAAVAAVPAFAWYTHATALARHSGFAFVQPGLFGHHLRSWFHASFLYRNLTPLSSEAFSPLGLGLAILGFFWPARNPAFWIFRLWTVGAGLFLFLVPDLLSSNYYYLSLLLPGGAALCGLVLSRLAPNRTTYPLLALVLAIFAVGAIRSALPLYQDDRAPRDLGIVLNQLTASEDLIAAESGGSPNVLYFAGRRGWMLTRQYNPALLQQLAKAGARYYADPSSTGMSQRSEFFRAMDANFERLTPDQGTWAIYRLCAPPRALDALPAGVIRNPVLVNFGDQVELLGISLLKLTASPAAFELLSFWRSLKESPVDLRAFVHVTNPAGETIYDANLAEPYPSTKWKRGEIMQMRSVVALPVSLPKAKYRISIGWLDAARGARLAIIKSDTTTKQDCAHVGEIEIQKTPAYGWFSPN